MLIAFMLAIVKQRRQTVSLRTTIGTMGWAARRSMRISSGKRIAKRRKDARMIGEPQPHSFPRLVPSSRKPVTDA